MIEQPNAFPTTNLHREENDVGMTLRDYFAAKALQGELACQSDDNTWTDLDILARRCYAIADAMLKAREQAK